MKRILYLLAGLSTFALATVGVILPILPTTPFLLLAAYCFLRSSPSFSQWLLESKIYQFYVADYIETRSIPRKRKWQILLNIYILMAISLLLVSLPLLKLLLALLTIFLTIMLFFIIPDQI